MGRALTSSSLIQARRGSYRVRRTQNRHPGRAEPRRIAAYAGYANAEFVWISGRVLADRRETEGTCAESWWDNVRAALRCWEKDEVANAEIELRYGDESIAVTSDRAGYYRARFARTAGTNVVTARYVNDAGVTARHRVFAPLAHMQYMIISAMDDTVIRTGITDLWTAARLTVFGIAGSRKPLKGVAGLYRALHAGSEGVATNPVFYLSNSRSHLYVLLRRFLALNDFPDGPLLLRDPGSNDHHPDNRGHKLDTIAKILHRFPQYPAVLIGDAGHQDGETYAQVARDFPGRVLGIYIRDAEPDDAAVDDVRSGAGIGGLAASVPLIRAGDGRVFARHMHKTGLLPAEAAESIAGSVIRDNQRERLAS